MIVIVDDLFNECINEVKVIFLFQSYQIKYFNIYDDLDLIKHLNI